MARTSVECAEKHFAAVTIATQCKLSAKLMSSNRDAFWFNRFSSVRNNAKNNCRAVIYTVEKYINRFTPKFYLAFALKERHINRTNKIYIKVNIPLLSL